MKLEDAYMRELLTRLDGSAPTTAILESAEDSRPAFAATEPDLQSERRAQAEAALEQQLAALRSQLSSIQDDQASSPSRAPRPGITPGPASKPVREANADFAPAVPNQLADVGLEQEQIEAIALKYLLNRGTCAGRQLAEQLGLPFSLMEKVLYDLKAAQLVAELQ